MAKALYSSVLEPIIFLWQQPIAFYFFYTLKEYFKNIFDRGIRMGVKSRSH